MLYYLLIVILFILLSVFHNCLSKKIPKKVVFVTTSILYFLFIIGYMYYNFNDCYEHMFELQLIDILIMLAVVIVTIIINLIFVHYI